MTTERTRKAIQGCAEWLSACVRLGWDKSDLDFLEALWWKYHDSRGNLIGIGTDSTSAERAQTTRRSEAQEKHTPNFPETREQGETDKP